MRTGFCVCVCVFFFFSFFLANIFFYRKGLKGIVLILIGKLIHKPNYINISLFQYQNDIFDTMSYFYQDMSYPVRIWSSKFYCVRQCVSAKCNPNAMTGFQMKWRTG